LLESSERVVDDREKHVQQDEGHEHHVRGEKDRREEFVLVVPAQRSAAQRRLR
jgi:hypothetical protein